MDAGKRQGIEHPSGVIEAARKYLGTPFVHQGRLKSAGVDCVGLLVGVARDLGLPHEDYPAYSMMPTKGMLIPWLERSLDQVDDPQAGDILAFWWRRPSEPPYHTGLLTGENRMIHTYYSLRKVVEHDLNDRWWKRVHSVWRYRWRPS